MKRLINILFALSAATLLFMPTFMLYGRNDLSLGLGALMLVTLICSCIMALITLHSVLFGNGVVYVLMRPGDLLRNKKDDSEIEFTEDAWIRFDDQRLKENKVVRHRIYPLGITYLEESRF